MADEADRPGFSAGASAAIEAAGPLLPLRDAEQLDLLRDERGVLERHHAPAARRTRGRPAGATNKRTRAWRDYLLSQYAHPLEVLAQIVSRPVDALAAELGCKPAEALAIQLRAATELAPYLEGKMPVEVSVTRRADVVLVMPRGGETIEQVAQAVEERGLDAIGWDAAEVEEMAENRHSSGDA